MAVGAQRTRVILELDGGEPVEGSLTADGGSSHTFTGWMELVAGLQAVIDEAAIPPENAARPATGSIEGES
jgi:hypothetical protein